MKGWWARFKQQECAAWTPRYTASSIAPVLFGFGILLVPIGVAVLVISSDGSSDMKEIHVDYTDCSSVKNESSTCADFLRTRTNWDEEEICNCRVEFELEKPIKVRKSCVVKCNFKKYK